ncbi:hypothetical protein FRB91_004640 [Serendipita sp. 411]|nr:hypothetical protein FRB91_004640 [Serendipita sp. 411]
MLSITFLGTCSGGGPLISRACTATALNHSNNSWLIDCAEGTQTQILKTQALRVSRINRIFITHMHVDHVMGLIPLLRTAMYSGDPSPSTRMHLYGPSGLRNFVRFNLKITQAGLVGRYAVHELLQNGESPSATCEEDQLHENEAVGSDIIAGDDGLWRKFAEQDDLFVDAGPISHRAPCIGYVFQEKSRSSVRGNVYIPYIERNASSLRERGISNPLSLLKTLLQDRKPVSLPDGMTLEPPPLDIPGRKVVILGDTSNPSNIIPIAMDASALVHESTNAFIPPQVASRVRGIRGGRGNAQVVRNKSIARGHSTADMAGEFAKTIRARRLYLNHFSTMFSPGGQSPPSPNAKPRDARNPVRQEASLVMSEIERQASEAWGMGRAIAAVDLMTVEIPQHEPEPGTVITSSPS